MHETQVRSLGRKIHGEGNGNPHQYSCLGIPMNRGAWWTTVHGVTKVGHDLVTKQQQQHLFFEGELEAGWIIPSLKH